MSDKLYDFKRGDLVLWPRRCKIGERQFRCFVTSVSEDRTLLTIGLEDGPEPFFVNGYRSTTVPQSDVVFLYRGIEEYTP